MCGLTVACCRVGSTDCNTACMGLFGGRIWAFIVHDTLIQMSGYEFSLFQYLVVFGGGFFVCFWCLKS